tara:strand:- start:13252 stop:14379 length:1128 start_codon:yes stop_codon:yes gene_type:complete
MKNLKRHNMVEINNSISIDDVIENIKNTNVGLLTPEDKNILAKMLEYYKKNNEFIYTFTDQEKNFLSRNHRDKWVEYLIYRYKFKVYPEEKIKMDFPVHILIELSSACNLRCVMCFQSDSTFQKAGKYIGTMDINLFKNIIDQAHEGGTKAITFASRGEPLYHKEIEEALSYVKGKFTEIKINTNAMLLNDQKSHSILKNCENLTLVFSIDAYTKELYEKIRVRGNFEKVLGNIRNFNKIKREFYPNAKVVTRASGVIISQQQDIKKLTEFWKNEVDEVSFEMAEQMADTYNNKPSEINHPCNFLWENMYIWFDGKCNPCDLDYKSKLEFGNVKNASIKNIWNGSRLDLLRKKHIEGNRNKIMPCDRCGVDFSLN